VQKGVQKWGNLLTKWILVVKCGNNIYIFELYKLNTSNLDIFFFGTFNCKADAKGRIMLPVALRNQVAPILKDGFFIKKSYLSECLELYPAYEWHRVMAELNEKSRFDEENLQFIRMYTAGLRQVEVDSTGRLLIPKDIISLGGITKEVVIAPIGKRLEIWDKKAYDESINASKEEKVELAKRVMLGKKPSGDVS
jgi:MraZ protein